MRAGRPARARHTKQERKKIMDSKKINAEIQKHYKAIKAAAKAARANKGSKAAEVERKAAAKAARADRGSVKKSATAKKAARKPVKGAARVDEGIYIAPVEDAPEAPQGAAEAKPRKATKVERKAAKVERKATAKAAARPDFEPVKLPAVFHSPDGGGTLEITATSITYSQGLREVIFPARSAHYFTRDYKAGERVIAAGSVGVKIGGKSLVIGPEALAIVAAVRTAKAAADKAAKAKGGAK